MDTSTKLYSQKAIAIATFFGGPLAAGILIRTNFINLNKEREGLNALILGVLSTLLLFGGIFALPENIVDKIPNSVLPAVYTGIIYLIVEKIQGNDLKQHTANNGVFYSGWRAAGIGFIGLVIIGATIFLAIDIFGAADFDADKYGQGITEFSTNEASALKIYTNLETQSEDQLIAELNDGINLWKKDIDIIADLNTIRNLPIELIEQNKLLTEYCQLRIDHYTLMLKSVQEDTDIYDTQIQEMTDKIDQKLNELN